MDFSEAVRKVGVELGEVKEITEKCKKMVEGEKVRIEEVEGMSEVKAAMAKNGEWEGKLELMKENMEGMLAELVVVEEEVESLLREVHKPPSLVDLAAGRVVEEGLGVGEIPTTLRVRVEGLMEERRERAMIIITKFLDAANNGNATVAAATMVHINTVASEVYEAMLVLDGELGELLEVAELR